MEYKVAQLNPQYDFVITGISYIGAPQDGTAMYVAKKVAHLIDNLKGHRHCLIFTETGCEVPDTFKKNNLFYMTDNPQGDYVRLATVLAAGLNKEEMKKKYTLTAGGYYLGENVRIGEDSVIEPGCFIGHDVRIGDGARIQSGTSIRHAVIGDNFCCHANTVIGVDSFTMARGEDGNTVRIPAFGAVQIESNVELGACCTIERGASGCTRLADHVKVASGVYIAHNVCLEKNVEVAAGVNIGGFTEIGEDAYVGLGAAVRNRKSVGEKAYIGMGSTVYKNVEDGKIVVGAPLRELPIK